MVDGARRSATAGVPVGHPDARLGNVLGGELVDGHGGVRRAVRLAAAVVGLEVAELGDRVRLGRGVEPVAAHLAAEPEGGVVDGRAVARQRSPDGPFAGQVVLERDQPGPQRFGRPLLLGEQPLDLAQRRLQVAVGERRGLGSALPERNALARKPEKVANSATPTVSISVPTMRPPTVIGYWSP